MVAGLVTADYEILRHEYDLIVEDKWQSTLWKLIYLVVEGFADQCCACRFHHNHDFSGVVQDEHVVLQNQHMLCEIVLHRPEPL